MTVKELHKILEGKIKEGYGDVETMISIPYRNGIGFHMEKIVNVSVWSNIVDIHTTMPDSDDIKN